MVVVGSSDPRLDEDRNPQQVVGANQRAGANMIAYADDPINAAACVLPVQIEIEFLTDSRDDRKPHSTERLPVYCVDNVAFDGRR